MELDKDIKAVIVFVFYVFSMLRPGVWDFFSLKDQVVNILVFVAHVSSVVTTQLFCKKIATDDV